MHDTQAIKFSQTRVDANNFAMAEIALGRRLHEHDGVWWIEAQRAYYKPLNEFQPIVPGVARPHPWKSLAGFSHQVGIGSQANRFVAYNILDGEDLAGFCIARLPQKKRNQVRQGQRACRVEFLTGSEHELEEMRLVNIVQAQRFAEAGADESYLPAAYYEDHAEPWRSEMRLRFKHPGNHFLAAWVGEELAAYVVMMTIEDTWIVGAVKSDSKHLGSRPVDALYFHALSLASSTPHCRRVVNGGPSEAEGVHRFKRQFLFRPVEFPYRTSTWLPRSLVLWALRRRKACGHAPRAKSDE